MIGDRSDRIFAALADGIFELPPADLHAAQAEEVWRLTALVLRAELASVTDDGAATPPAAPPDTPVRAGGGEHAAESATGATNTGAALSSYVVPGPDLIGGQPGHASPIPRRFHLYRHTDVSHVSGTGVVAWGVQWPDGAVSVRWHGDHPSTVAWASVKDAIAVHGHSGATEIRWLDEGGQS